MSRNELAEKLGISISFCSNIELGKKNMSIKTLVKMAQALHVSTDYILFGTPESAYARSIMNLIDQCNTNQLGYLEKIIKDFITATK